MTSAEIVPSSLVAPGTHPLHRAAGYGMLAPDQRKNTVQELEALFFDILTSLQPDLFIEAGAKDARTSRRARSHLPNARIVAFEANPFTYKRFAGNKKNRPRKVEYLHRALSNSNGEITFKVRMEQGKPAANGQGSILPKSTDKATDFTEVTVETSRLDSVFPNTTFNRCALWVDVEGAHEMVLSGAQGILAQVDTVFIEVEDRGVWKDQWLAPDVERFFAEAGLIAVARDYQSRIQYNILFLRPALAERPEIAAYFIALHKKLTAAPPPSLLSLTLRCVGRKLSRLFE